MDTPTHTPTALPTASGPTINSPSDLSYSSGPSHTSTRNTSPDSVAAVSRHSSPLLDLSVAAEIEHTTNTLLDAQPTNMDRNSFQSINDRRNKLANERATANQFQHPQQQQQQPQLALQPQGVRPGIQQQQQQQPPPGHIRSLTSANWRAHPNEDVILSQPQPQPQPRNMYNIFDATATHHLQHHPSVRNTPYPSSRVDHQLQIQHPSITPYPNFGPISDTQLDGSYAYCYDRGNGQYTRLIPADMLPPLQNIPALQQSCTGMVVLPQPRGLSPNGYSNSTEPVAIRSPPATPTSPADNIQSRIDNIVAATPSTPTHVPSTGHPGIGPSSSSGAPPNQRRPKIYCDKWVHEGVCAFTQQGCKYKHEMPSDKVTQHQLGLFHGYPQWWKKHQSDLARQREVPLESPRSSGQANDSKSNTERYLDRTSSAVGSGGPRGGGLSLTSDAGGQLGWRHSGEYGGDPQMLGTPSSMIRGTISRGGVGASVRNPMGMFPSVISHPPVIQSQRNAQLLTLPLHTTAASSPDNNLSPCPVSYGSPFGPIAPPARSNAAATISTETVRGSPAAQAVREPDTITRGTQESTLASTNMAASSMLPTSNPYASLDSFDDSGEQSISEINDYAEAPRLGGARLP
ncbi:hypothetical protein HD806DRAFT_545157 [Xylariaceae sp. AK1471]|nr:hypothetical protein HD806DRAFT_545157 [Xylariaceae sp. AK1471]